MKEPVGQCVDCGKTVYCDGGFLDGIILENKNLRCRDCDEQIKDGKQEQPNQT